MVGLCTSHECYNSFEMSHSTMSITIWMFNDSVDFEETFITLYVNVQRVCMMGKFASTVNFAK